MPEGRVGVRVHPGGTSGASVPCGREFPMVATLAVDVIVTPGENRVVRQLTLASVARGALGVVVFAVAAVDSLCAEDRTAASRTILLRVL